MGFQVDFRAACVALLTAYAGDAGVRLQTYPARPRTVNPPTAFVDSIREVIRYSGPTIRQRTPTAEVIVVHGLFDSKDAADQRDAFVDGFLDWALTRYHQASPNTLIAPVEVEDLPSFVPDWLEPAAQRTYYATRIAMEGYSG